MGGGNGIILIAKRSTDATLWHVFNFKLIFQLLKVSSEKFCFKTDGILHMIKYYLHSN